jgi:hypothetical protein
MSQYVWINKGKKSQRRKLEQDERNTRVVLRLAARRWRHCGVAATESRTRSELGGTAGQEEREKKSQHRITGGRKCIGIYVPVGRGKHDGMGLLEGTAGWAGMRWTGTWPLSWT